jgi:predicted nucleic acid-binding protein
MITIDTDVLIEILDKKSEKGDEALKQILQAKKKYAQLPSTYMRYSTASTSMDKQSKKFYCYLF